MAGFSPRQALLAGPCFILRRPGVIACWLVLVFAQILISSALLRWMTPVGPLSASAAGSRVLGAGWALLATIPFQAVLWSAAVRAFLRPEERQFAWLRLGGVELRMAGLVLLSTLFIGLIGVLPTLALASSALWMGLPVRAFTTGATDLGSLLGTLMLVRFVLAPAILVDRNRASLSESWRLTRSIFWPLAGLLLSLQIVRMIANWLARSLVLILTDPVAFKAFGSLGLSHPNGALKASLPPLTSISQLALGAYGAALSALGVAIVAGVITTAYQTVTAVAEPRGRDQGA